MRRVGDGHVLGVDRSERAVAQALAASREEVATGRLAFRVARVEELSLEADDEPFDLAFAVRVGALDGRHPQLRRRALERIAAALGPDGRLYVDTGDPLAEVELPR